MSSEVFKPKVQCFFYVYIHIFTHTLVFLGSFISCIAVVAIL